MLQKLSAQKKRLNRYNGNLNRNLKNNQKMKKKTTTLTPAEQKHYKELDRLDKEIDRMEKSNIKLQKKINKSLVKVWEGGQMNCTDIVINQFRPKSVTPRLCYGINKLELTVRNEEANGERISSFELEMPSKPTPEEMIKLQIAFNKFYKKREETISKSKNSRAYLVPQSDTPLENIIRRIMKPKGIYPKPVKPKKIKDKDKWFNSEKFYSGIRGIYAKTTWSGSGSVFIDFFTQKRKTFEDRDEIGTIHHHNHSDKSVRQVPVELEIAKTEENSKSYTAEDNIVLADNYKFPIEKAKTLEQHKINAKHFFKNFVIQGARQLYLQQKQNELK